MIDNLSMLKKDDWLTDETLHMIMEIEKFEPRWYPDPILGWDVPTVMYGHTDKAGNPKYKDTKNTVFTKSDGKIALMNDLYEPGRIIKSLVKVPLEKNQYGALLSLVHNIGTGNFSKSTLLLKLNRGDYQGAADQFEVWHYSGGRIVDGLCNRRDKECKYFTGNLETKKS